MISTQARTIRDGFPGQRMLVMVRSRIREFLNRTGSTHIAVSDCGYFPHARRHGLERRGGVGEGIIIVCAEGAGWCRTDAGTFPVVAGQVIVLPPHSIHAYGSDDDDPWSLWWVHLAGYEVGELFEHAGLTAEAPVRNVSDAYRIVGLMQEILAWTERDSSTVSLMAAAGAAWHLVGLVASTSAANDTTKDAIDRAAEYLRTHVANHVTVSELASLAKLSPSHFADRFKSHTGLSVLRYQKLLRMTRAREMLDTTSMPIARIANDVGYTDAFYFARQFKAVHGVTPSAYRSRTF